MDAYLEGTEPDDATLKSLIRKGTISRAFVPVTCGSAVKNKGVQQMLDAVIEYLPSPLDLPDMNGFGIADPQKPMTLPPSDDAPFSGLAFRSITDSMVGSLTFLRVFSGTLASGAYVLNATKGKKERIGRLLEMHANRCVGWVSRFDIGVVDIKPITMSARVKAGARSPHEILNKLVAVSYFICVTFGGRVKTYIANKQRLFGLQADQG